MSDELIDDELDEFELELESQIKEIKRCQNTMNMKTCFDCPKLFECNIRKEYVQAVYNSMSKGQSGGFEF